MSKFTFPGAAIVRSVFCRIKIGVEAESELTTSLRAFSLKILISQYFWHFKIKQISGNYFLIANCR